MPAAPLIYRKSGARDFTEALAPPAFGRIGHPAQTVVLLITSREQQRSDLRAPPSNDTMTAILFAKFEKKANFRSCRQVQYVGRVSPENLNFAAAHPRNRRKRIEAWKGQVVAVASQE